MFTPLSLPLSIQGIDRPKCELFSANLMITDAIGRLFYKTLSESERDRMMKFIQPDHQRAFLAARGGLRSCLSQRTNCPPEALVFTYKTHGKPMLQDYPELHFNLSHSRQQALLGISWGRAIGVDLEQIRSMPKMLALAKRFFTPSEYDAIVQVPDTEQEHLFFKYWTCKEAYLKATGDGLGKIRHLEIDIQHDSVQVLNKPCAKEIILATVAVEAGFVGAIAVEI